MSVSAGSGGIRAPVPRDSAAAHRARIDRTETPSEVRWVPGPDIGAAVTGPVARHRGPGPPRRAPSRRTPAHVGRSGRTDPARTMSAPVTGVRPEVPRRVPTVADGRPSDVPQGDVHADHPRFDPQVVAHPVVGRGDLRPARLPRRRVGGHPAAGGHPAGGGLRLRVGDRRPRPVGGRTQAGAGRRGAARVRLRGRDDGLHGPRHDGRRAGTAPGTCCGAGRETHLPHLHRNRLRDGQAAPSAVEEGAARPDRHARTTRR